MVHHRYVMGVQTFSSHLLIIYLCPFVFYFSRAQLLSQFDLRTDCLSLKLAAVAQFRTVIPHFVFHPFPFQSVIPRFPRPPFISSVTMHLSPLLSLVLSSLHRYPNVFIFSPLLTFIQFVFFFIAVSIFSFPIAPTPIALFLLSVLLFSLLSHSNAPLSYLPSMVFSYCQHMVNYLYYTEIISISIAPSIL